MSVHKNYKVIRAVGYCLSLEQKGKRSRILSVHRNYRVRAVGYCLFIGDKRQNRLETLEVKARVRGVGYCLFIGSKGQEMKMG